MVRLILIIGIVFAFCACQKTILGDDPAETPRNNFEYLWKTIDERYTFFDYKHVNWDSVHAVYSPLITNEMDNLQLFSTLGKMLNVLRDAHVNLTSPFRVSRYEDVFLNSPENIDNHLINNVYLGNSYFITGSFQHQIIANNQVGYVRYTSFETDVSGSDLDFIINRFKDLKGIIIDVRSNDGGYVENVLTICDHFINSTYHVYTSYLKNGPGHDDFAKPDEVYISPAEINFTKKVCVLTNRGCYSATSFFVLAMRNFPNVTIVGDTTGGGLGEPSGAELPNGWGLRFSSSKTLSPEGENFEDGIPPDVEINLDPGDVQNGIDTIIEKAISIILAD